MSWDRLSPIWQAAMTEALESYVGGTTPIGAVITNENADIVSRARSTPSIERLAHAETKAIQGVPESGPLFKFELFTTLEPCPYCTGAIRMEGLGALHFAARDPSAGSAYLFNSSEFFRVLQCKVFAPEDAILESVNVAVLLESRTRRGQGRWREQWHAYSPDAANVGERLAASQRYEQWVEDGTSVPAIYDEVAAHFA